ncbi:MAG: NAD(P)H-dependent oxidoreductase [bacterium]
MANVVVIQGHASSNSFTQAITREFVRALREGHAVQEFNAYETDLPFADPSRIQHHGETTYPILKSAALAADAFVFAFPVWLAGMPAAMKNVLDHFDFAWSMQDNKLTGKLRAQSAYIIRTADAPNGWNKSTGNLALQALQEPFKALGIRRWGMYLADGVGASTLDQRKRHLGKIYQEGQKFARTLPA